MSVAASANLESATRDLMLAWNRAQEQWRDAKSQQFHHQFIEPLPDQANHARNAMGQLEAVLRKIKNDCD